MRNNIFRKVISILLIFTLAICYFPKIEVYTSNLNESQQNFDLKITKNSDTNYTLSWNDFSPDNLLYYVAIRQPNGQWNYNFSENKYYTQDFSDTDKPKAPDVKFANNSALLFESTDVGTNYECRVIAIPLGLSFFDELDTIDVLLNDDSIYEYSTEKGTVYFSDVVATDFITSQIREQNTYEYYIDTNPIGVNKNGEFIDRWDPINLPTFNFLAEDLYLHIYSYDNNDNVSFGNTDYDGTYTSDDGITYNINNGITNVNLWDNYPKFQANVKYKNKYGEDIVTGDTSYEMLGSLFDPNILQINGYKFIESNPEFINISADSDNSIIETYDQLLTKNINIVIENVDNPIKYLTVSGTASENFILDLPEFYQNYKFSGYYTIGDNPEKISCTLGDTLKITDSNDINVIYEPIKTTFNVIVKDSVNNIEYANFPVTANAYDTFVVSQDLLTENLVNFDNKYAYQNYSIIDQSLEVYVTENTQDQVIELIPRTKTVRCFGFDFTEADTTSASGISIEPKNNNARILATKTFTYDGVNEIIDLPQGFINSIDGYTLLENSTDGTIDFTNKINNIDLMYYKGELPDEPYTTYVSCINLQSDFPIPTFSSIIENPTTINNNLSLLTPVNMINFSDFELDSMKVTVNDNEYEYSLSDNYYEHLPNISNNALTDTYYIAEPQYKPYITNEFNTYIYDQKADSYVLSKTNTMTSLYLDQMYFDMINNPYPLEFVSSDGDIEQIGNENKFTTKLTENKKVVNLYFKPITYNLDVVARVDGVESCTIYSYSDIYANTESSFIAPELAGYTLENSDDIITFDPNGVGGDYTVYLDYNKEASVNVSHFDMTLDENGFIESNTYDNLHINDTFKVSSINNSDYKIKAIYVDGEKLENSDTFVIDSTYTQVNVLYIPRKMYTVNITNNIDNAGTASITSAYDVGFYKDDLVTISATANDGYIFSNWVSDDISFEDSSNAEITFTMPNTDVSIIANFKSTNQSEEIVDSIPEELPEELPKDPIYNFQEIIVPDTPVEIGNSSSISDLVNDPVNQTFRKYEPYISGYEDNTISPNGTITRAEAMQIIYNLYGYGLYRDSYDNRTLLYNYSDVDTDVWYSDAISFCLDYGIVEGYSDGTMRPDTPITRAELSSILSKFVEPESNATTNLTDIESSWAAESISTLYNSGVVEGYSDDTFRPNQTTTRSEFTKMVSNVTDRTDDYYNKIMFDDIDSSHWAYTDIMNAVNGGIVKSKEDELLLEKIKSNEF